MLIGILWIPFLLEKSHFIEEKKLEGWFEIPDSTFKLNDTSWFDVVYQEKYEKWYNFNMGLHTTGVRLSNQIDYWTLQQKQNVIIGKNNELMGQDYIYSYLGRDFVGQDSIEKECIRIRQLQATLKKHGIDFFIVIAPNKTRIYNQHIPDFYHPENRKPGNYESYVEGFKKFGINQLNVQSWFEHAKDTSRYPLFTNLGVHWSIYGGMRFTDSLLRYTANLSGRKLNHLKLSFVRQTDTADATDNDLEKTMNLLFTIKPNKKFAYIEREPIIDSTNERPRLLAVGDSYWWTVMNFGVPRIFFADSSAYFYYNSTAFFNFGQDHPVAEVNPKHIVLSSDIILLIYTEPNLKHSWNGFVERALSSLSDSTHIW